MDLMNCSVHKGKSSIQIFCELYLTVELYRATYNLYDVDSQFFPKHKNSCSCCFLNLLKTTGHVIHQQFNTQKLYVLPTLYLCVLYLSENKQRLVPLTA